MEQSTFIELFNQSNSIFEFAKKLGYKKHYSGKRLSGSIYKEIKRRCEEVGLNYKNLSNRYSEFDSEDVEKSITEMVPKSKSIREVIVKIGGNPNSGSFFSKVVYKIKFLGLDTSHFTGQQWNKGKNRFENESVDKQARKQEIPWEDAFKKGSATSNSVLMKRLIVSGKRKYECSACGIKKWNGKALRIRMDHIDGDNTNNAENNLRFLCPNCDSQTDTFCRGKKKRTKKVEWWRTLSEK